ncbi:26S proteasome regulatory subunit N1 [Microbotryum lychnidis-dioicae p1A1 Lamole]|uniref:26S proteasome regulatory subunit RPN1 n=1 Tax=Microbotryum lychnidis-dioicae (strain p1A1 Lamole / MvSl-1064) TaxID=683840 RepID=U5HCY2_USTV1|nr:26S proteasome regulatory subunit N1 [Microbotryum lychnidis-dioicae p1A1 Lamole]|eukprot:KDE04534.1 26S proteasome regulatory subunit N1 [Microbotryum lychnidis-dioicae p1A1 Lamole]
MPAAEDERDPNGVPFIVAPIPSKDPVKKDDKGKSPEGDDDKKDPTTTATAAKEDENELSEEDAALKSELEMLVERLKEADTSLYRPALESLRTLIRTSTSSLTSVPKPLKHLRPHYADLAAIQASWPDQPSTSMLDDVKKAVGITSADSSTASVSDKSLFADILSVLAMTYSDSGKRETLSYRLKGGSEEDSGLWGHEYVRHLAAELGEEYLARQNDESSTESTDDLLQLGLRLVPFLLTHNGEADAVDLLLELESIPSIVPHVDKDTYARVCLYMVSCVNLLISPDDQLFLKTAREIYRKHGKYTESIALSLKLQDMDLIKEDFESPTNPHMKRQLAYLLARQQVNIETDDEDLVEILNNTKLTENFKRFGKELNVTEPKSLEDIYKSHLENTSRSGAAASVDSARQNLAGTFVNAFVNAGFGNDKLMVEAEEGQSWIYKNKDHGMFSAAASLGVSLLWDTDVGLSQIDKYAYATEEHIKAGAMLANGLIHSGIRTEMDAALALLSEHVESKSVPLRVAAIVGIGIAYAGTQREDIRELLLPAIADSAVTMEIAAMTSLALGFIFVGSCDGEVTMAILQTMMEREEAELKSKWGRFLGLGLAVLYLSRQDASDATIETLKAIEAPIGKQTLVLVEILSYAGTGNVLKIQSMLNHCYEHIDAEKEEDLHQAFAVLGIAVISMGEDVGSEMAIRQLNHLMHYGESVIRRAVPLALGLISASNPVLTLLDTLSRYSHDNDLAVSINAIFAMGLVGAGTNNARLAQMLRQLASYYAKEPDCLFMVRIAQGLVHMGKGTIGINPFHTDRTLMSPVAVAGLLATIIAFTDSKEFILDKSHWMLYFIVMAMYPRFLITFNEEGEFLPATVRVGTAVDVVGQAGKPRTISGFQTHQTPVRLGQVERAELATEEYISYSHVLEGYVILRKNEGYEKEDVPMDTK